eukprot:SAG11_NODE_35470_length_266_cov_0.928144_1_plen_29_part_10
MLAMNQDIFIADGSEQSIYVISKDSLPDF